MPWEQYQSSEMKSNVSFLIRNNDNAVKNTFYSDTVYNVASSFYNGGSANINPGLFSQSHGISYSFPTLTKDSSFLFEGVLNANPDNDRWNDTLRYAQTFSNYYAYDDGTAESSYGLLACPGPGQIAYKFTLNQPDTLFAVTMLFNWVPQTFGGNSSVNQQPFKIRVWGDNGGMPAANYIYEDTVSTPNYWYVTHPDWGNLTNMYYPYILRSAVHLPAGTFYVGFIQYVNPCSTLVNLGLDKNTDARSKMFYNLGSGWSQSSIPFPCSWMMRPVLGSKKGLLTVPEQESQQPSFSVYPNPSQGKFEIKDEKLKTKKAEIFNLFGEKVFDSAVSISDNSAIDISEQPSGIYLLRITDEKGIVHSQKLILTR